MLRRPFLYGAAAMSASIMVFYFWGAAACFGAAALLTAVSLMREGGAGKKALITMSVFCWAGFASFFIQEENRPPIEEAEGERTVIEGQAVQVWNKESSRGDDYIQIKMSVECIDGRPDTRGGIIMINCYGGNKTELIPGERLLAEGIPERPQGRRNPGCFDYSLYLRSVGITMVMDSEKIHVIENEEKSFSGKLYGELHTFREEFLEAVESAAGEETEGFVRGIMFGEKTGIEEDTMEEFQQNGTAHILSVSGLHIGIIYGVFRKLWPGKKGKAFVASSSGFFFCYAVMSGFSPSVVRAAVMVGIHSFASVTGRRYDLSSAAFFILIIMLARNPWQLFNAGLQMSFLAVLTIALISPFVRRVYTGMFAVSIAVQAGIAPYIAYNFNCFSLAAAVVNVPVIFLTGLIVPLCMFMMAVRETCGPLFDASAGITAGLCGMLDEINSLTATEGLTVFNVTSPTETFLAAYYLSLLIFASEEGRLMIMRKKKKALILFICIAAAASLAFGKAADSGFEEAHVIFVDVGQGDCMHFRTDAGENYLIDGGGKEGYNTGKGVLKPYLLKNGVRMVDGAFVTHLHTDHYKGIAELCREGMVKRLFLYEGSRVMEGRIMKETGMRSEDIVYVAGGDTVELEGGGEVRILWPERRSDKEYERLAADSEDENESSLVIRVSLRELSFTATGDVERECQDEIAKMWEGGLKTDILKASHHGSRYSYSESFTEASDPVLGIFQVGKNNYGHPDEGVIEKYTGKGIIIYRNDRDGAIGITAAEEGRFAVATVSGKGRQR